MLELFDYQKEGADFLAGRRRGLLLDAPGLGKTLQGIRAADRIGADSLDVICPASVVTQWGKVHAAEAETNTAFRAYSYENARDKGISSRPTVLLLDELHYLKNPASGRTAKILGYNFYGTDGLIQRADYVWGMSGTLMPKDASDLWPIMWGIVPGSLLMPISRRTMDYWEFLNQYCTMYRDPVHHTMRITGSKNLEELKERLAPYMLRRTKKQAKADWKEPETAELWLDPDDARDMLTKAELEPEGRAIAEAFAKGGFEALAILADSENTGVSRLRRYVGILKVLPVVKWLLDQFDGGLEKIVLICVHREVVEAIHQKLADQGVKSAVYYGGMSDAKKETAKNAFTTNPACRAFIANITAAGTGLDGLQHATGDMLFVEWSWISDDNYQAICRLDREGQENPVLARFAGLEGSLDGAIMASARRRAAAKKSLFD